MGAMGIMGTMGELWIIGVARGAIEKNLRVVLLFVFAVAGEADGNTAIDIGADVEGRDGSRIAQGENLRFRGFGLGAQRIVYGIGEHRLGCEEGLTREGSIGVGESYAAWCIDGDGIDDTRELRHIEGELGIQCPSAVDMNVGSSTCREFHIGSLSLVVGTAPPLIGEIGLGHVVEVAHTHGIHPSLEGNGAQFGTNLTVVEYLACRIGEHSIPSPHIADILDGTGRLVVISRQAKLDVALARRQELVVVALTGNEEDEGKYEGEVFHFMGAMGTMGIMGVMLYY